MESLTESQEVPMVLIEVLVAGSEQDREYLKPMMELLQKQVNKYPTKARVLWYCDNGEKTYDEKKKWLLEQSKSRYCYIVPEGSFSVAPDLIKKAIQHSASLESALKLLKSNGIFINRKKIEVVKKKKSKTKKGNIVQ
jgi:hypothetical protein